MSTPAMRATLLLLLALLLLVLGVAADHHHRALAADDLATLTARFDGCTNFHMLTSGHAR
jgi:hypothetical protein